MLRIIEDLAGDWRQLDARIEGLSDEIETLARQDKGCERLMTVTGIGPIISSAMVAAIGTVRQRPDPLNPRAPARGAPRHPQVETTERPSGTNKGTARSQEVIDDVINALTPPSSARG
jgi:transposase